MRDWSIFFLGFALGALVYIITNHIILLPSAQPKPTIIECKHTQSIRSLESELKLCFIAQDKIYDNVNKDTVTLIDEVKQSNKQLNECLNRNVGISSDVFICNSNIKQCAGELNLCAKNSFK